MNGRIEVKRKLTTYGIGLLFAMVLGACAAAPTNSHSPDQKAQMLSAHDAAELIFLYHQVAQAMWNESRRLEMQAAVQQMRGEDTTALLEQAEVFARVAVAAEAAAANYRGQVRNNQLH
jgi:hypothetical protein